MHKTSCAIVIPTYNNAAVIESVVKEVIDTCKPVPVIVVNDGSTDSTHAILSSLEQIHYVHCPVNGGKGAALRAGFQKAEEIGATNVITFDGDGQHKACDLPLFITNTTEEPHTLFIGNRTTPFEGSVIPPSRSSTGRKIGNFWFKFITRIVLHDTQCGFRSYPLNSIREAGGTRPKYDYEQELMIRCAWNGTPVKEIDIHLFYQPEEESMSHFRPFRDFMRITAVNSRYAFIRTINPFLFLDVPGKTWNQKIVALVKHELRGNTSPRRAGVSFAMGIFFGLSPIHGLQVISTMGSCVLFSLNKPLAFLGVSISSAPFLPFIIAGEIAVGNLIIPPVGTSFLSNVGVAAHAVLVFVTGSLVTALVCSLFSYLLAVPLFTKIRYNRHKKRGEE